VVTAFSTVEERNLLIKATLGWAAKWHPNLLPLKLRHARNSSGELESLGGYSLPEALEQLLHEADWSRGLYGLHSDYQAFIARTVATWDRTLAKHFLTDYLPSKDAALGWAASATGFGSPTAFELDVLVEIERQKEVKLKEQRQAAVFNVGGRNELRERVEAAEARIEFEAEMEALAAATLNEQNPNFGSF
jgi:hypothetical protein